MTRRSSPSPDPAPGPEAAVKVNKRAIPRQATSAVAFEFVGLDLPDDDPLLDFWPYRHARPRRNSILPDVQRAFILALAETGIVTQAAARVGKSLEALYKLREKPGAEDFARAWDEALAWGVMRLEDCAMERAIAEGLSNPRANSMLCWVLQHRGRHMVNSRLVRPGHWLYERIREELLGPEDDDEEDDAPEAGGASRR
jgi:hypothetical protein